MAAIARFMSKHLSYITYVNGIKVVFERGNFSTPDEDIAEGLRKSSDFGITLIEVNDKDLKEKQPESVIETVDETVKTVLESENDDEPIRVSKHAKGKKK